MAKYIVLLGPPGAGKGTQAQVIAKEYGLVHISSGDLFRENLKNETDLGKLAQGYMSRGELVPDDVTIAMVKERISRPDCSKGALLDGFPRTPAQADALAKMLEGFNGQVSSVPYIAVPADVLIDRLSGRWSCPVCGTVYHDKFNPPQTAGHCDKDGAELIQREDDQAGHGRATYSCIHGTDCAFDRVLQKPGCVGRGRWDPFDRRGFRTDAGLRSGKGKDDELGSADYD